MTPSNRIVHLLCSAALILACGSPAAAETIAVGRIDLVPTITPWFDPGHGVLPYAGAAAYVTNTSPVSFPAIAIRIQFVDSGAGIFGTNYCAPLALAPGAIASCETGPVEVAPQAAWGLGYYGYVMGYIGEPSFLLPDGSTFIADTTFFTMPQFGDMATPTDPTYDNLSRLILIEGTIVPREDGEPTDPPLATVPEPGTLTLLLTGSSIVGWRARRRTS